MFNYDATTNVSNSQSFQPAQPVENKVYTNSSDNVSVFSKYLNENDRDFTIDEQMDYTKSIALQNEIVQSAVQNGFNVDLVLNELFFTKFSNVSKFIENLVLDDVRRSADIAVKNVVQHAQAYLASPPENMGEGWGYEPEHMDYVFSKLESMGVPFEKISTSTIAELFARIDYNQLSGESKTMMKLPDWYTAPENFDKNGNPIDTNGMEYYKKDEKGNPVETHVLDYIVNNYKTDYVDNN